MFYDGLIVIVYRIFYFISTANEYFESDKLYTELINL